MGTDYEVKPFSYIVLPAGEPIFHEGATIIGVNDDAAGCYLTLTQEEHTIKLDFIELPFIWEAITKLKKDWSNR